MMDAAASRYRERAGGPSREVPYKGPCGSIRRLLWRYYRTQDAAAAPTGSQQTVLYYRSSRMIDAAGEPPLCNNGHICADFVAFKEPPLWAARAHLLAEYGAGP